MRPSPSPSPLALLLALTLPLLVHAALDVRLITYNVRFDASWRERHEKPWAVRGPLMAAQLNYETAGRPNTLMCFQEALHHQILDLQRGLGSGDDWAYVGIGRDGGNDGEFSTIFYRPDAWELQGNVTYWLSPTPRVPGSKGWDAMFPRIVTIAKFKHAETGEPFVYMCTHFDHVGQVAREKSADMLVNLAHELADAAATTDASGNKTPAPVFLAGDLNSPPTNNAYKILACNLGNSKDKVPPQRRIGNTNTYTAFTDTTWDDEEIDFIFVRDAAAVEWVSHATPNSRFDDKIWISDHRPVIVDLKTKA